jgi:hypothetical protein
MRWASLGLGFVTDVSESAYQIKSWHYGEIELREGKLHRIYPRWWPRIGSAWESMVDSYIRRLPEDHCRVYYAFPLRSPGFMSVLYAYSGPRTSYKTLLRGVTAVEEIARLRNVQAIVCQATNPRLNERLMSRLGYVRHAHSLGSNHYIKRLASPPSIPARSEREAQ